jgi:hypothetical protein
LFINEHPKHLEKFHVSFYLQIQTLISSISDFDSTSHALTKLELRKLQTPDAWITWPTLVNKYQYVYKVNLRTTFANNIEDYDIVGEHVYVFFPWI